MNRFYASSFENAEGTTYASVVDRHLYSHVYYRVDSLLAREFVKDYAKSLNASYKFIPGAHGNIIGGSEV